MVCRTVDVCNYRLVLAALLQQLALSRGVTGLVGGAASWGGSVHGDCGASTIGRCCGVTAGAEAIGLFRARVVRTRSPKWSSRLYRLRLLRGLWFKIWLQMLMAWASTDSQFPEESLDVTAFRGLLRALLAGPRSLGSKKTADGRQKSAVRGDLGQWNGARWQCRCRAGWSK